MAEWPLDSGLWAIGFPDWGLLSGFPFRLRFEQVQKILIDKPVSGRGTGWDDEDALVGWVADMRGRRSPARSSLCGLSSPVGMARGQLFLCGDGRMRTASEGITCQPLLTSLALLGINLLFRAPLRNITPSGGLRAVMVF